MESRFPCDYFLLGCWYYVSTSIAISDSLEDWSLRIPTTVTHLLQIKSDPSPWKLLLLTLFPLSQGCDGKRKTANKALNTQRFTFFLSKLLLCVCVYVWQRGEDASNRIAWLCLFSRVWIHLLVSFCPVLWHNHNFVN